MQASIHEDNREASAKQTDATPDHHRTRPSGGNVRSFLDRLYWVLGTLCLTWSISAVICIFRQQSLDLPVLGKADVTETIIFTSIGLGLLVPLLLYVVAIWRTAAVERHWHGSCPGAPTDKWDIPPGFSWLRPFLFVALVWFPIATMQLCYHRMLELEIHWVGSGGPAVLRQSDPHGHTLFDFPPKPAPTEDYSNWRWIGSAVEGETHPSRITAAPGYEPWAFWLVSYGCIPFAVWFLFTPPGTLRGQIRRKRN